MQSCLGEAQRKKVRAPQMPLAYVLGSQHMSIHMGQEAEPGTQIFQNKFRQEVVKKPKAGFTQRISRKPVAGDHKRPGSTKG